jgi:streptomycin 6-kinase
MLGPSANSRRPFASVDIRRWRKAGASATISFMNNSPADAHDRLADLQRRWRVTADASFDTPSSVILYGRRGDQAVVLKVMKQRSDEWLAGEVLRAFDGKGVVRVHEYVDGAVLVEHLHPATPLVDVVRRGDDAAATAILCDVIDAMSPGGPVASWPTVREWAQSFGRYAASGDTQVPADLVALGEQRFLELCESQRRVRLLHGDLQHYNVLHDRDRGWIAIDPKGVVGELEYEIGAVLRNPNERPDLFSDPLVIERRLATFASRLGLDGNRMAAWAFAQAVLSAIWSVEDGYEIRATNPALMLAATLRRMLGAS